MELKKHFSWRRFLVGSYFVLFAVYLCFGLMPADAMNYAIAAELTIPSIGLESGVTNLSLDDNQLITPDTIVGSYSEAENKTLLIGHASTVFQNLKSIKLGDQITYNGNNYHVTIKRLAIKSEIDMEEILAPAHEDTLIIMTCAGANLSGGDATHRLIVTATRD